MEDKYNRLCVSISDKNNEILNDVIKNRKIHSLTKSAVVDLALMLLFKKDSNDSKTIAEELSDFFDEEVL